MLNIDRLLYRAHTEYSHVHIYDMHMYAELGGFHFENSATFRMFRWDRYW